MSLAASLAPQIVIMDLGLPGMNGVDASRAVLQVQPHTRFRPCLLALSCAATWATAHP